jgi:hypothetical protein
MPDKSPYDMSIDQLDDDSAAGAFSSANAQDDHETPPRNGHSGATPHQRVYQGEFQTALPPTFCKGHAIILRSTKSHDNLTNHLPQHAYLVGSAR